MVSSNLSAKANGLTHAVKDGRQVSPLGMNSSEFVEAANLVVKDIENYYTSLPSQPVISTVSPGYLRELLPASPPEHGEDFKSIEADIHRTIMPGIVHWQHPKFMAFFPANSSYPGILGEMWSAALTSPAFNWICSPAVTELETIVLDWFAQMLHLAPEFHSSGPGGGVIHGSASEALLTCMVAARERFVRDTIQREAGSEGIDEETAEDRACSIRATLVAMGSDQAHSSTKKAANIAGVRFRGVPTRREDNFSMKADALRQRIADIRASGLNPFFLTVTLGSTSTCTVDDFNSIAEVARENPDIWIHCDAAYAGPVLMLPEYQHIAKEIAFVDSFNTNAHKWLLTNFDASALFVRARGQLKAALDVNPPYLANAYSESGLVTDYRNWQIPLGRRFRALKLWFVMRTFGSSGLREHLRFHISLGELFASLIRSRPDLFAIFTPPAFALTVFTVQPPKSETLDNGASGARSAQVAANAATEKVYELMGVQLEYNLTSTIVDGVYAIRVVSANPLAEERCIRGVFDALVAVAEEVVLRKHHLTNGST